MTPMDQMEIDFVTPISPWAESAEKERKKWTPEMLCLSWVTGRSFDVEDEIPWWNSLPEYERRAWRNRYDIERDRAGATGREMTPPGFVLMGEEESYRNKKRLAEQWAKDLREAFLAGKPCPIKPTPEYEWVLMLAFELSSVNPESIKAQ